MSTLAKLESKITKLSNVDAGWVQFILDHLEHIRRTSIPVIIDDASRDRYRHKLNHFLRENGCTEDLQWIAYLINNLTDYTDFTTMYLLNIPDRGYIINLYRSYRTANTIIQ